ncbi:thioredoxin family protein [Shimwellia blattae]|uniref:Thioredoxin n=1 Tax=Shimwellia blattae (strain ATCC 29907 / DSM 4481 / JCM 1650 / NBRC 105725 / CDC 9005-74) TaxID=630626 RepID=I2BAJ1_SHIBC|nr:thioredoxin domain-containing protein [Shimwellia blattae]AFJ47545.1 thioredoxin [Shimwellia blattae DSM 4481 = NBRC 105725]GAB79877.1 hypothetical protein EB105725_03_01890 [Shimwellia blattae DSM 4481 = NBRC 105725]VDY65044.1 Thioredoxin [Shimwellia blattae]VEC23411.1 Thioredoxin [Shimwellia blattae]
MIDITAETLSRALRDTKTPVLLDFWAPWCAPCIALEPWLEQLAARYGEQLTILRCNVDQDNALIAEYGLRGVPTLIGFEHGQEVARCTGGNVAQLHAMVNRLLQSPEQTSTGGAFSGDSALRSQVLARVQQTPPDALPRLVAGWLQHPATVPGIPPLVWQVILFLAQQYPEQERNRVFTQLLSAIHTGARLSDTGRVLARHLLMPEHCRLGCLFDLTPALAACWQALQRLQLAHLQGEAQNATEWQAARDMLAQCQQAEDPAIAAAAASLAPLAFPVNGDDLSLFLELYRLASDERADQLYQDGPEPDMQVIESHLQETLKAHTRLLGEVLGAARAA